MPAPHTASVNWGQWPDWLDDATDTPACRDYPTDLFFPENRTPGMHGQIALAKTVCARCPLLRPCREWAHEQPPAALDGIWGGTTHNERKQRAVAIREAGD